MEVILDVSMLEPCEPLERTLEAVRGLQKGAYLRVIHRREPHPLFPLLEQGGFQWVSRESRPGRFEIFIWKRGDASAEQEVKTAST